MPRKKRKPTQNDIERAYHAAKEGKMSIRQAAKKFNIPKSTLIDKVKGKSPLECKKGPKQILSTEEEVALAEWGVKMAGIGYMCIRTQILYTVKTILDKDEKEDRGREKRFGENNLPGKDWWVRFCDRHSKLKRATLQVLERGKKLVKSDAALCKWESSLKRFLQRHGVKDPACIFTCTANRFLVEGHRSVVRYCFSKKIRSQSQYLTVLTAASANGKFVPPMIVYPSDAEDIDALEDEAVEGTFFTKSRNGDLSVELFYSWIGKHFLEYAPSGKNIVLLIEANWPCVDMYVSRLCKDKKITLFCMPPPSSHFREPLLWGFSKQLPNEWKMESMNFELLNPGMKVDKYAFPAVFSNVWTHLASENNARLGFERSGVWPSDSQNQQRTVSESDHLNVLCFDEDGNKIEVAMYEEVISDIPVVGTDVRQDSLPVVEGEHNKLEGIEDESKNVLKQFEEAQSLTDEQKAVFESRFEAEFKEQHDLVYNAWKALKELMVMKQDTAAEYENRSDEEYDDDDDDSLLGWLSDEDDEDEEKENVHGDSVLYSITKMDDNGPESKEEEDGDCDDNEDDSRSESGSNKREKDCNDAESDWDCISSSSEESLRDEKFPPSTSGPTASPSRTAMSPLKISRYVHPGAAAKRKRTHPRKSSPPEKKKREQSHQKR
ncbi:uncharacterized protein [Diadema antillarum]|uniref:uncharacterized protein n=1 Tax=Diadema antillarum TaxID=105358 RepID=UPI003A895411